MRKKCKKKKNVNDFNVIWNALIVDDIFFMKNKIFFFFHFFPPFGFEVIWSGNFIRITLLMLVSVISASIYFNNDFIFPQRYLGHINLQLMAHNNCSFSESPFRTLIGSVSYTAASLRQSALSCTCFELHQQISRTD